MSGTPRTDAFIAGCEERKLTIWQALPEIQEHARQLERDLCKALAEKHYWRDLAHQRDAAHDGGNK